LVDLPVCGKERERRKKKRDNEDDGSGRADDREQTGHAPDAARTPRGNLIVDLVLHKQV